MLVEVKSGETYNGHLVSSDTWMNLNLREVICTSRVRAPAITPFHESNVYRTVSVFGVCPSAMFGVTRSSICASLKRLTFNAAQLFCAISQQQLIVASQASTWRVHTYRCFNVHMLLHLSS